MLLDRIIKIKHVNDELNDLTEVEFIILNALTATSHSKIFLKNNSDVNIYTYKLSNRNTVKILWFYDNTEHLVYNIKFFKYITNHKFELDELSKIIFDLFQNKLKINIRKLTIL